MTSKFDFTNEEPWEPSGGSLFPLGQHVAEIVSVKESESQAGNPQIEMTLADDSHEMRDWVTVTAKTAGKVVQLAKSAGIGNPGKVEIPSEEWSAWVLSLRGRKVGIVVVEEPSLSDPSKTIRKVDGHIPPSDAVGGADTSGLPAAGSSSKVDSNLPF